MVVRVIGEERRKRLGAALEAEVVEWLKKPMQWGTDDCALVAGNVIRRALHYDPVEAYRERYSTAEGAYELLGKLGLGFAWARVAKTHGWTRIDPKDAKVGDVGLVMMYGKPHTVICKAPGWFIGRADNGVRLMPAVNKSNLEKSVRICWSVSHFPS